ncbi:hypothetical protein BDZ88DRAFT_471500 [Geranomyces variabilis]|nr:hypothetical protein BDZ88DRAFT_471500 [Geranomyces variabilis]
MLAFYSLALASNYQYDAPSPTARDWLGPDFDLSNGGMLGSWLLLFACQSMLPAIQVRLAYNEKWTHVAIVTNSLLFATVITGWTACTAVIGYRVMHDLPDLDSLTCARMVFFTVWMMYSVCQCITIAMLVIRLLVSLKTRLAASLAADGLAENGGLSRDTTLDRMQQRTIASACVAIPLTLAVLLATYGCMRYAL